MRFTSICQRNKYPQVVLRAAREPPGRAELLEDSFCTFWRQKGNVPFHHQGSVPLLRVKQRKSAAHHRF